MNMYESVTGLCQPCHQQCSGGCSGASNRECTSCRETSVRVSGGDAVECVPSCPNGMVYNSDAGGCQFSL